MGRGGEGRASQDGGEGGKKGRVASIRLVVSDQEVRILADHVQVLGDNYMLRVIRHY